MSQPQRLGDTLSFRAFQLTALGKLLLRTTPEARTVPGMTTNDTDRVTALVGQLIDPWIDVVPDEQVIEATKNEVHDLLEEGTMFDQPDARERVLLELITLLGFTDRSDVWTIQEAVFPLIDSYDLFND